MSELETLTKIMGRLDLIIIILIFIFAVVIIKGEK